MTSKKTAAILTVVGGIFYVLGGILVAGVVDLLSSSSGLGDLGGANICGGIPFCNPSGANSSSGYFSAIGSGVDLGGLADILLAVGVVTGGLIIFGGWLINSESSGRRKTGAILAIVMVLIGGLTTFGGLVIGFILTCIGVYLALTYRSNSRGMVIPIGPMASVTLGPQSAPAPVTNNLPAGTGPLNYCTRCGSQIRPGSVFCGACGARLGD